MLPLVVATTSILTMAPAAPHEADWKPIAASVVLPGAGQWIQGRSVRAVTQVGAALSCLAAYVAADRQTGSPSPVGMDSNVRTFAAVGLLGLALWSPLDAWLFEQAPTQVGTVRP